MNEEMTAPESSLAGRVVAGRYRVERLLAEGGMGRVYRAVQIALDRPIALKCIHPHLVGAEEMVSRFLEEARLASRLSHPNIVQIYDFGQSSAEEGAELYLAMELVEGVSLDAELDRLSVVPQGRAVDIVRQVLAALGEAHAHGIIHRDVKPENVILSPSRSSGERVKLIDFGIARASGAARKTQAGLLVGTPHYIAPELVKGEAGGPLADLYAAGAMLFRMLTGTVPFDGPTVGATLMSHLAEARPDPRSVAPDRAISDAVALVCIRAIALDPKDRYQSAEELAEALRFASRDGAPQSSTRPKASAAPQKPMSAAASASSPAGAQPSKPVSAAASAALPAGAPASKPVSSSSTSAPSTVSERYTVLHGGSGIDVIHRLEQRAFAALGVGDREGAARLLTDGVTRARALDEDELGHIAGIALGTMGCRLAALLRADGKLVECCTMLGEALAAKNLRPGARALLLEQLARTHLAMGSRDAAEHARIDALLLAVNEDDDGLLARLEDLENSTTVVPPAPAQEVPKRSTWRSRDSVDPKRRSQ
jgi:serine/threonine protein kinase